MGFFIPERQSVMRLSIRMLATTSILAVASVTALAPGQQNVSGGVGAGVTFGGGQPTTGSVGTNVTVSGPQGSVTGSSQTTIGGQNSGQTSVNVNVNKK